MVSAQQVSEAFNYAESAKVNLASLAVQVPQLKDHPYFKIVSFQIEEATRILSGRPDNEQLELFGEDHGRN